MEQKVVLAYSGGLDTTVCIRHLIERHGRQVVALLVDVGQGSNLRSDAARARACGASEVITVDARERFLREYAWPALRANAAYQDKYLLSAALSRPLIATLLIEHAHRCGASAVAHGCTGKGNDQVRFDLTIRALDPELTILAPIRELALQRDAAVELARAHGIEVEGKGRNPFSIDANLWGRSIECGILEDPWQEPPEEAFLMTSAPDAAPNQAAVVEVSFEQGIPTRLNGRRLGPVSLVRVLNEVGGSHGVGRVDHIEDRLVGIKSREVYEAPGAHVLHLAHRDLEELTLNAELLRFKKLVDQRYAELIYAGRWASPLRQALDAFISQTQQSVCGRVRIKLYRGKAAVVGRHSDLALYERELATYEGEDTFNQAAAEGFIELFGLDLVTLARRDQARVIRKPPRPAAKKPASAACPEPAQAAQPPPGLAAAREEGR
ncbi:MAG: argininosuccinate synthase [Acidobacteriota bacterium]